jgi:hypothetical protein
MYYYFIIVYYLDHLIYFSVTSIYCAQYLQCM